MAGKGDKRRPSQVSEQEYSDNWDRIFTRQSSGSNSDAGNSTSSPSVNAHTTKDSESKGT